MRRFDLAGRTALVTGAGSGIGRALTHALVAKGMRVVATDRDADGLAGTVSAVADSAVTTRPLDVTDRPAIHALADRVAREHGRLDLLVNNAGIAQAHRFEDTDEATFDRIMTVNFDGTVQMCRAFLPLLRQTGERHHHARIVNISSLFGIIAPPRNTAYSASKFAVAGFTQSLGHELRRTPVGVSVVHPGGVATAIASNDALLATVPEAERDAHLARAGALLRMPPPRAAATIVRGIERRRPRIVVGRDARATMALQRLAPVRYWRVAEWLRVET